MVVVVVVCVFAYTHTILLTSGCIIQLVTLCSAVRIIFLPILAISGHIDGTSFHRVSLLHFLCFPVN